VLGSARLHGHLIDTARTFTFDTGQAPAIIGPRWPRYGPFARDQTMAGRGLARANLNDTEMDTTATVLSDVRAVGYSPNGALPF